MYTKEQLDDQQSKLNKRIFDKKIKDRLKALLDAKIKEGK